MKPLLIYKDLEIISSNKPDLSKNLSWYIFYPLIMDREFRVSNMITNTYLRLSYGGEIKEGCFILEGALLPDSHLEQYKVNEINNENEDKQLNIYEYKENRFYTINAKGKKLYVFYSFKDKALYEDTLSKFEEGRYSEIQESLKKKILDIFATHHTVDKRVTLIESTYSKIINPKKEDIDTLKNILSTNVEIKEIYSRVDMEEETFYID